LGLYACALIGCVTVNVISKTIFRGVGGREHRLILMKPQKKFHGISASDRKTRGEIFGARATFVQTFLKVSLL